MCAPIRHTYGHAPGCLNVSENVTITERCTPLQSLSMRSLWVELPVMTQVWVECSFIIMRHSSESISIEGLPLCTCPPTKQSSPSAISENFRSRSALVSLLLQTMWSLDLYTYVMLLITWTPHCDHMTMDDIMVHKYFCCIIWSMHTSHDLCIHCVIYPYIAPSIHIYITWSMHTLHDLCIHRVIYAYIAWSIHTSQGLWYIICYTSHDLCIHQVTYGYITWSTIHPLLIEHFYKWHPIVNASCLCSAYV